MLMECASVVKYILVKNLSNLYLRQEKTSTGKGRGLAAGKVLMTTFGLINEEESLFCEPATPTPPSHYGIQIIIYYSKNNGKENSFPII